MLTFIKFGGSVITDKTGQEAPDLPTIRRLAAELRSALDRAPDLRVIIGHGSGSFGFASARAMVDAGFAQLRLDAIIATCEAGHPASARVLEKAGFTLEGVLRASAIKDGRVLDQLLYARIRA
jgi:isopentenyl phosphate kinase